MESPLSHLHFPFISWYNCAPRYTELIIVHSVPRCKHWSNVSLGLRSEPSSLVTAQSLPCGSELITGEPEMMVLFGFCVLPRALHESLQVVKALRTLMISSVMEANLTSGVERAILHWYWNLWFWNKWRKRSIDRENTTLGHLRKCLVGSGFRWSSPCPQGRE